MKIRQFLILLLTFVFVPLVVSKNIYSGNVSYVKFKDDGSFTFQLTVGSKLVVINDTNCSEQSIFWVKKRHGVVKHEKLTRMRGDIRDAFLLQDGKIVVSVSTLSCDKRTGYILVDNIMLGKMQ